MKSRTYYEEGKLQRLEQKIRQILAEQGYGGKAHEVDNLYARLPNFFIDEYLQNSTRRGIEKLIKRRLEPSEVEEVARSIYDEYRSKVSEGIEEIYHPRSHFFMRSEVRQIRNWTVTYAALLDIIDKGNKFAQEVAEFDKHVRKLLKIYHNLFAHESTFLNNKDYETYIIVAEAIDEDRRDLGTVDSGDVVIKKMVGHLKGYTYTTSASILSAFVYHLKQNGDTLSRNQLANMENARRLLSRRLSELDLFSQLGNSTKEFYGERTIYDLLERKK